MNDIEVVITIITAHDVKLGCFVDIVGGLDLIILALVYSEEELVPVTGNVEWSN